MNNSWVCVDANLVIRLTAEAKERSVRSLWLRWDPEGRRIVAPTLLPYEVAYALYRYQELG
jgi:predicted nucleic acid-binding protein